MISLEGKVAIVTGASHGIGRSIAEIFAEAGARVVAADIEPFSSSAAPAPAQNNSIPPSEIIFEHADVSVPEDVLRVVETAGALSGRIDVVCNNAAYLGPAHASALATEQEWEHCFRVSLLGTQGFIAAALPYMIRQQMGSIINIASVQGLVAGRDSAAYTSMKHAIVGLTRSVAYDYGSQNIRANSICPGAIQTRISPNPGDELYQRQISKTFLGRVGMPREVAFAALFLASELSSYITGAAIPVDGGWTAM
ncbi:MAG TPA: SDR family NAD(P)-dependent oxidoreductase [Acidobacteriaceae bacterium]|nr:SDR family NAD(P)-dependent oxidoreductase [Acidobacteriaceae bacterium]